MTEIITPYHAGAATTSAVYCSICRYPIGIYTQVGTDIWISVGGVELYSAHGRCHKCGLEWHWHFSDKPLDALTHKMI